MEQSKVSIHAGGASGVGFGVPSRLFLQASGPAWGVEGQEGWERYSNMGTAWHEVSEAEKNEEGTYVKA